MRLTIYDITIEEIRKIIKALGLKENDARFEFGVIGEVSYPEDDEPETETQSDSWNDWGDEGSDK